MIKINIRNLNRKKSFDQVSLKRKVAKVLKKLGYNGIELNIIFVSNQEIKALNRRFLRENAATDVMAFPYDAESDVCTARDGFKLLGDIAISSDKAEENARVYGKTFLQELTLYVIHGILHLDGYDDVTEKKAKLMRKKENELLEATKRF
ncbi:MAG: rRNA maturation RNase YbeY [Candidatus Omnitrophica bacterium]|nr:rRNA maturation RNase YbeY [Candidatus Omnitrophota bacterium]